MPPAGQAPYTDIEHRYRPQPEPQCSSRQYGGGRRSTVGAQAAAGWWLRGWVADWWGLGTHRGDLCLRGFELGLYIILGLHQCFGLHPPATNQPSSLSGPLSGGRVRARPGGTTTTVQHATARRYPPELAGQWQRPRPARQQAGEPCVPAWLALPAASASHPPGR